MEMNTITIAIYHLQRKTSTCTINVIMFCLGSPFSINGVPACANRKLLTEILRDTWKFTGYVISDQSALERIVTDHHYVKDFVTAAADAVNAGVSLEISRNMVNNVMMNVGQSSSSSSSTESRHNHRFWLFCCNC